MSAGVVGHIGPKPAAPDMPYLDARELAAIIRADLKQRWPATKFSVRMKRFSMGSDITVSWTDGPTTGLVDAVLEQYRGKTFDGSDDSTHHNPIEVNGKLYHASAWVNASHRHSRRAVERAYAEVCAFYGLVPEAGAVREGTFDSWVEDSRPACAGSPWSVRDCVHQVLYRRNALEDPSPYYTNDYLNWEATA